MPRPTGPIDGSTGFHSTIFASMVAFAVASAGVRAEPFAYVANDFSDDVSVIDTASESLVTIIAVGDGPDAVAVAPDGAIVYVANFFGDTVSVIDSVSHSVIATLPVGDGPDSVVISPDGATAYVANFFGDTVSVIDTANHSVIAALPAGVGPDSVTISPNGAFLYVTNNEPEGVWVIDTANLTLVATLPVGESPTSVALTPDGTHAYVTNFGSDTITVIETEDHNVVATLPVEDGPIVASVTPDGATAYVANFLSDTVSVIDTASNSVVTTLAVDRAPAAVSVTPDGALAYVANFFSDTLAVIDTTTHSVVATLPVGNAPIHLALGPLLAPPVPLSSAVLPSSRSVQIGQPAVAFASIMNQGLTPASKCRIAPPPGLAAKFSYQTTDPSSNALKGSPNTPTFIPPGQSRTFLISVTPNATIAPSQLNLSFSCDNAAPAASIADVNSLTLSASSQPVADIVALASTMGDPGVVDAPLNGSGVFAVATSNLGATAAITAAVKPRPFNLPVSLAICQTDPRTGICLGAVGPTLPVTIANGETPTFAVFVAGLNQAVPLDPANSRVIVEFLDAGGALRGSTSVAVRTIADPPP